jgi:hypothetical protein
MPDQTSLQRTVNAVVVTIIVLAVLGMGLGAYHALRATEPSALAGMLAIFILPGLIFALAKFVVTAVRAVRDPAARLPAALLLGVLLLPAIRPRPPALTVPGAVQEPMPLAPPVAEESEQFLAGRDWASERGPTKFAECPGSQDFMRGCRSAIEAHRKQEEDEGMRWAKANVPAKASECKGLPHVALGCRRYYFANLVQAKPAGQGKYEGMTTAECQTEVNANYELAKQLDLESGNLHSIEVTARRSWEPELRDCENFDKMVANAFMPKAWARLDKILEAMKAGHMPSGREQAEVLKDYTQMAAIPDQPYKASYMTLYAEYTRRLDGASR